MNNKITQFISLLTSTMLLCSFTTAGYAQGLQSASERTDRWQASFQVRYMDAIDIDFDGGAEASLNDDMGWAFGLGYNLDEHWEFDFDIGWSEIGYSGTRIDDNGAPQTVSGTLYTSSANFSGLYNFSAKRFTPFIGASIGWTFVDTNIPNGLPQTICWYDPWWGYICDTQVPTKTSTDFSYGAMLGLRFDIRDNLFFRGSVGKQWVDFDNTRSTPDLSIYRFDIGFMF